jgi:hypothetical protein
VIDRDAALVRDTADRIGLCLADPEVVAAVALGVQLMVRDLTGRTMQHGPMPTARVVAAGLAVLSVVAAHAPVEATR